MALTLTGNIQIGGNIVLGGDGNTDTWNIMDTSNSLGTFNDGTQIKVQHPPTSQPQHFTKFGYTVVH